MSLKDINPALRAPKLEWPTLLLVFGIYALWAGLVWFHERLPNMLWLPLAAWTSAWWGSAQHEMLHGHPTRLRWLNTALALPPFWLWLPFERYRETHLTHHNDERLTDPLDDPESRYLTAEQWAALGRAGQLLVQAQTTLAGRLIIGPLWSIATFWHDETRAMLAGSSGRAGIWLRHGLASAILIALVVLAGLPLWKYLLGFVYLGTALALVRSFAEHRAEGDVARRTAIVERTPLFGLLFLNNNLHVLHHRWPCVPWYRLPAIYRAHREAAITHNGGLVYAGYAEVFRRYLFRPHDRPVHPLGRVPEPQPDQAGRE
jgi:fatty acid desaturase